MWTFNDGPQSWLTGFPCSGQPDDKAAAGIHPLVVHGMEKAQRILEVVQALHRVHQIHGLVRLPGREHGFHVVALRVNGPCFGDHRRCAVHAAGVLAQVVCGKPTDDPTVSASDVHRRERTVPTLRRRSSITSTLALWPRSMPSSRPTSAHSLNKSVAGRRLMEDGHPRRLMKVFMAKGRCTALLSKVHA